MFHFHHIRKIRKPKLTADYRRKNALHETMSKAVKADLLHGLSRFRKSVSPQKLMDAWKRSDYAGIIAQVKWEGLPDHLKDFDRRVRQTYQGATGVAFEGLPAPVKERLRFDINNPRLRQYINRHTASLVQNIDQAGKRAVQTAVTRSFTHAYTPKQMANFIRDSIVLDERRETALANYRNRLEGQGSFSENRVDQMVEGYANRLLDDRCEAIARTEIKGAVNYGQLSVWREGEREGLLKGGKGWQVDGNPCPEVCEPMDGIVVGLDDFWELPTGEMVEIPSDAHTRCMCDMYFDYDWSPDED